jgi:hypothetical protein
VDGISHFSLPRVRLSTADAMICRNGLTH